MLDKLRAIPKFVANADASAALDELDKLFAFLEAMSALENVSFDLSLARGLDYYTGVIYEAVLMATKVDENGKEVSVGSVAAGGRYDGLVGMYSGKDIPAVGVSIGVERVFSIKYGQLEEKGKAEGLFIKEAHTQVVVGSIGSGYLTERMKLCSELWEAGIKATFVYKANPNMKNNFDEVFDGGVPFMVVFGESELAESCVNVKDIAANTEEKVPRLELVADLKRRIAAKGAPSLLAPDRKKAQAAAAPSSS